MSKDPSRLIQVSRNIYLCFSVFYMGGIYYLSSLRISFDKTDYKDFLSFCGNLFHFPLYAGLGLSLLLGFRLKDAATGKMFSRGGTFLALLLLGLYGLFDEYHQSWTGRTPSLSDLLMDLCGGAGAFLFLKYAVEKSLSFKPFVFRFGILCVLACLLACAGMYRLDAGLFDFLR